MKVRWLSAPLALVCLASGCGGGDHSAREFTTNGLTGFTGGVQPQSGFPTFPTEGTGGTGVPTTGGDSSVLLLSDGGVTTSTSGDGGGFASGTTGTSATTTGVDTTTSGVGTTGAVDDAGVVDAAPSCEAPLAPYVKVDSIALYQGVRVPLMEGGQPTQLPRNAPVVQGRDALVRVFASRLPGFTDHAITAALTLTNGADSETLSVSGAPQTPSEGSLGSTYNFDVPGDLIGPDTRFDVALLEDACGNTVGQAADARFPSQGNAQLFAEDVGAVRVKLVPVAYQTGGGTITPDVSDAAVARYRAALQAYYPVTDVEVSVRAPFNWSSNVSSGGDGWETLLDAVLALGNQERQPGEYFYGLIQPASSAFNFCRQGCVAGLAPVGQLGGWGGGYRASGGLGLAFDDDISRETLVHELGHAHGRDHTPCGIGVGQNGVDPRFPYSDGSIGVWGYDLLTGQLKSPSQFDDVMGYCDSNWISDYTYEAIADWVAGVNDALSPRILQPKGLAPASAWVSIIVPEQGDASWGAQHPSEPPPGELVTADVLDAAGNLLDQVDAVVVKLSHSGSRFVYLPEPGSDWAAVRVAGATLQLDQL